MLIRTSASCPHRRCFAARVGTSVAGAGDDWCGGAISGGHRLRTRAVPGERVRELSPTRRCRHLRAVLRWASRCPAGPCGLSRRSGVSPGLVTPSAGTQARNDDAQSRSAMPRSPPCSPSSRATRPYLAETPVVTHPSQRSFVLPAPWSLCSACLAHHPSTGHVADHGGGTSSGQGVTVCVSIVG